MEFNSKKVQLVLLALTAFAFSRAMFVFFNDPEGPNLLIVSVAALFIYFLSLTAYAFGSPKVSVQTFLIAIGIQIVVAAAGVLIGLS